RSASSLCGGRTSSGRKRISRIWEQTMTGDQSRDDDTDAAEAASGETTLTADIDLDRAIEALLMVADEPQSVMGLATALNVPVRQISAAIERLVDDYDGVTGSSRRGFELREVGGGWRVYVREDYDDVVAAYVSEQN